MAAAAVAAVAVVTYQHAVRKSSVSPSFPICAMVPWLGRAEQRRRARPSAWFPSAVVFGARIVNMAELVRADSESCMHAPARVESVAARGRAATLGGPAPLYFRLPAEADVYTLRCVLLL